MVGQRVRHHEARVVVQERRQVDALLSSQQEGEQVRLPELIRLCAFEPRRRPLAFYRRQSLLDEPGLVEDPAHHRLWHAEPFEAREDVADPASAILGVLPADRRHRLPALIAQVRRRLRSGTFCEQSLRSYRPEGVQPVVGCLRADPERARHHRDRCPALDLIDDALLELEAVAALSDPSPGCLVSSLVSSCHLAAPFRVLRQGGRQEVLGGSQLRRMLINWRAGQRRPRGMHWVITRKTGRSR